MHKVAGTGAVLALIAASLAAASPAVALSRVGNDCYATDGIPGATLVQLAADPKSPLPLTSPVAGVVTRWTTKSTPGIGTYRERLKVLRGTEVPNRFTVVGESAEQTVLEGVNTFTTRIRVQPGDRFGLYGAPPSAATTCPGEPEDKYGYFEGDVPIGASQDFNAEEMGKVAVYATIEPDADGDGFGDETQDGCPQSAAVQVACPPLSLGAVARSAGRRSVVILVATSTEAAVTVSGSVKQFRLYAPQLTVRPGEIGAFTLTLSNALRSKLAKLPKSRSLSLNVTAAGQSLAGVPAARRLTVRLKGRR
jgi:hypothetical protein